MVLSMLDTLCRIMTVDVVFWVWVHSGSLRWALKIKTSRPVFNVRGKKNNPGDEPERM